MPIVQEIAEANRSVLTFSTGYGQATIHLFRSKKVARAPNMVLLVAHGWQPMPIAIAEPRTNLPCFAWFVPAGVSLSRTRYDGWLGELVEIFSESRLAFCTTGIPNAIVGAHYIEPREAGLEEVLAQAITICDIAVLADMESSGLGTGPYQHSASLPLAELLTKWPHAEQTYSAFLLHTCRAKWPPQMAKGTEATASGIYSFNDDFKSLVD